MANYTNLKSTINAQIRQNGTGAITGPVLNGVLRDMVSALGEAGYLYKGIATPATTPGTPDSNVFYIASTAGTYTNFGGKVVADGEVAILKYNGTWTKEVTGAATAERVTQFGREFIIVGKGSTGAYSDKIIPFPYAAGKTFAISVADSEIDMTGLTNKAQVRLSIGLRKNGSMTKYLAIYRVGQTLPGNIIISVPQDGDYDDLAFFGRCVSGTTIRGNIQDITDIVNSEEHREEEKSGIIAKYTMGEIFSNEWIDTRYAVAANKGSVGVALSSLSTASSGADSATYFVRNFRIPIPAGAKYAKFGLSYASGRFSFCALVDENDIILDYYSRVTSSQPLLASIIISENAKYLIWQTNLFNFTTSTNIVEIDGENYADEFSESVRISKVVADEREKRGFMYGTYNSADGVYTPFYPINSQTINTIRIHADISVPYGARTIAVKVGGLPDDATMLYVAGFDGDGTYINLTDNSTYSNGRFVCIIPYGIVRVCPSFYKPGNLEFTDAELSVAWWKMETEYNPFLGKKYCALGDSITYGYIPRNYPGHPGQLSSYAKLASEKLGMQFENFGISGNTLAYHGYDNAMCVRYTEMPDDADVISVMGGTNDVRNSIPLGQFSDRQNTTFYGALHTLYQGLYTKYIAGVATETGKKKKIIAITPIKLLDASKSSLANTIANNANVLYQWDAWIAAVKEVAAFYSIPVMEFYNLSGINPHLDRTIVGTTSGYTGNYNPYITDGTHPTQEGAEIMADVFVGFLKTLK